MVNVKKVLSKVDLPNGADFFIYGASVSGKKVFDLLKNWDIKIAGFIDDDVQKQKSEFERCKVFSLADVIFSRGGQSEEESSFHIIIGSIYFNSILENIKARSTNQTVVFAYDIRNFILDDDIRITKQFIRHKDKQFVEANFDRLYDIFTDSYSKRVIDVMKRVYAKQYVGMDVYEDICSCESQYFTSEVLQAVRDRPIRIIDAGACKGELIGDLYKYGVNIRRVYMFEIEDNNFNVLKNNVAQNELKDRFVLEKKGLWCTTGKIYLAGEDDQCKIVPYKTDRPIDAISIDEYMLLEEDGAKIDFIKMDIEGSELDALKGAKSTILRDRPILAICIYHSPDDFVGIPLFLSELLSNYEFKILHHTVVYVESILYAIPKEVLK